jgi:hypothetical protein
VHLNYNRHRLPNYGLARAAMAMGSASKPIELEKEQRNLAPRPPRPRQPGQTTFAHRLGAIEIDLTLSDEEPRRFRPKKTVQKRNISTTPIYYNNDDDDDDDLVEINSAVFLGSLRRPASKTIASASASNALEQRPSVDTAVAPPINDAKVPNAVEASDQGLEDTAAPRGKSTEDTSVEGPSVGPVLPNKGSTPIPSPTKAIASTVTLSPPPNSVEKGCPGLPSINTHRDIPTRPTFRMATSQTVADIPPTVSAISPAVPSGSQTPIAEQNVPVPPVVNASMHGHQSQARKAPYDMSTLDYVLADKRKKVNAEKPTGGGQPIPERPPSVKPTSQKSTSQKPSSGRLEAEEPQRTRMIKTAPSGARLMPRFAPRRVPVPSIRDKDVPAASSTSRPNLLADKPILSSEHTAKQGTNNAIFSPTQTLAPVADTSSTIPPEHEPAELGSDSSSLMQVRVATVVQPIDVNNLRTACELVDECVENHVQQVHLTHSKVARGCLRRQRLCYERERQLQSRSMMQGRMLAPTGIARFVQSSSPFKKLQPIQTIVESKSAEPSYFAQEVFIKYRNQGEITSRFTAPLTHYRSTAVDIPPFQEHVSLQDNVLSENEKNMLHWPYFPDENENQDMMDDLKKNYKMKNDTPTRLDLLWDVSRFYTLTADSFLADLGLGWEHVLYWYLASERDIKRINSTLTPGRADFERVLLKRELRKDDNFRRDAPKWERLLKRLQEPTVLKLRLAALVSTSFLKQCDYDLWHLARRSKLLQKETSASLGGNTDCLNFQYKSAMCRVCQMHNCAFHGELREQPDEKDTDVTESQVGDNRLVVLNDADSESDNAQSRSIEDVAVVNDSDIEEIINYRRTVNSHNLPPFTALENEDEALMPKPTSSFKADWWLKKTNTHSWEYRKPFYPCSHDGTCDQAQCRCYIEGITCEKSCRCSAECLRRFPGCSCAQGTGKQGLCNTDKCLCHLLHRECDMDLCGSCGATEILDPINRYKNDILKGRCCNVALQRGVPKKTLLGHSEVHGFGLYTGEDIKKDDFIGEYKAEVITINESHRRSIIYHERKTMYLFNLNMG